MAERARRRFYFRLTAILCTFSACFLSNAVLAGGLLDCSLRYIAGQDFISYFGFADNGTASSADGLSEHSYYSKTWTCSLILSMNKNNRVVHLKLGVPRPLIDDAKVCTRGRDIVKSFIMASAIGQDVSVLKNLADEIYVRGLDLQPIKTNVKAPAANHNSGLPMQAYKIGKGPLASGDDAIFLSEMPGLSAQPSELFQAIMGKRERAGQIYQNCRLAFTNENMPGAKGSMKLLWCDSWDEAFWKATLR